MAWQLAPPPRNHPCFELDCFGFAFFYEIQDGFFVHFFSVRPASRMISLKWSSIRFKRGPQLLIEIDPLLFDDERPLQHLGMDGADVFPNDPGALPEQSTFVILLSGRRHRGRRRHRS